MDDDGIQRKLTAIMSADVAGYTRLMRDDELATLKALTRCRETMFELVRQHKGRVVDAVGDNMLAEFSSVVDAIQSAIAIQKELAVINSQVPEHRRMDFRIGINVGDVIQEGERIYGDGVNIAARLEKMAEPGGICISRTAYDQIESKLPVGYEYLGERTVKNINKPVYAYRVIIDPTEQQARHLGSENFHSREGGERRDQGEDGEEQDHFERIRHRVKDFAKDISEDEHIRQTFRRTGHRVKDLADEVSTDPAAGKRMLLRLWSYRPFQLVVVFGAFLFLINAFTAWGNWWFRFPVLGLGLAVYIRWLMTANFSPERMQALEERLIREEAAKFPTEPDQTHLKEIEEWAKARITFYRHFYLYAGVVVFLFLLNMVTDPFSWWFIFPALGWGIGIFFHWFNLKKPAG